MKAILFIGTARELRQRLALCKLQSTNLVAYACRKGPRPTAPTWTEGDEHLRNFASSCGFAGPREVKQ